MFFLSAVQFKHNNGTVFSEVSAPKLSVSIYLVNCLLIPDLYAYLLKLFKDCVLQLSANQSFFHSFFLRIASEFIGCFRESFTIIHTELHHSLLDQSLMFLPLLLPIGLRLSLTDNILAPFNHVHSWFQHFLQLPLATSLPLFFRVGNIPALVLPNSATSLPLLFQPSWLSQISLSGTLIDSLHAYYSLCFPASFDHSPTD